MHHPQSHTWVGRSCARCGLSRSTRWCTDAGGAPVMVAVWTSTRGQVTIRPFAHTEGVEPTEPPAGSVDAVFPRAAVGLEPVCPPPRRRLAHQAAER